MEGRNNNWTDPDRTGFDAGNSNHESAAAIRADIERTRDRMSRTVEDLGERLNPDRLKGQLKQNIHDATIGKAETMARNAVDRVDDTRHSIMDSIRDNPIPAAMVGLGLGWLFINGRRDDRDGRRRHLNDRYSTPDLGYSGTTIHSAGMDMHTGMYQRDGGGLRESARDMGNTIRERTEDISHRAQDRVTDLASEGREQARHLIDRAHETIDTGTNRARTMASDLVSTTRRDAHLFEDRFDETMRETPLAIGAAAVALGMAVGFSAPPTRREAELMGGRRDELLDRAREAAGDMTQRVREAADRVVNDAKSTLQEAISEDGMR